MASRLSEEVGAKPTSRSLPSMPSPRCTFMAFGLCWMPAPTRVKVSACSYTIASIPACRSAAASASPPMPAPTIAIDVSLGRRIPGLFGGFLTCRRNLFQEGREIVGHVIDMRVVAAFELPALAEHLARVLRHDQHRGHAERVWHREVARQVLEHGRAGGIDAVRLEEALIGLCRRLRLELGCDDVEHVIEM